MNFIKKHYKLYLFTLLFLVLSLVFTTTLYYFNIIGDTLFKWFNLISILLVIFASSIKLGVRSEKNGYLEGFKFAMMIVLLLTLITFFIIQADMETKMLLYDLIITFTSIFGSMIGINKVQKSTS